MQWEMVRERADAAHAAVYKPLEDKLFAEVKELGDAAMSAPFRTSYTEITTWFAARYVPHAQAVH